MPAQYLPEYKNLISKNFFDKYLAEKDQSKVDGYFKYISEDKPASIIANAYMGYQLRKIETNSQATFLENRRQVASWQEKEAVIVEERSSFNRYLKEDFLRPKKRIKHLDGELLYLFGQPFMPIFSNSDKERGFNEEMRVEEVKFSDDEKQALLDMGINQEAIDKSEEKAQDLRDARNYLFRNLEPSDRKYYSMIGEDTFDYHLKKSVNKFLKTIGDKPYKVVSAEEGKSGNWVLGKILNSFYSFQPSDQIESKSFYEDSEISINDIVLVDDCSYSGGQIFGYDDDYDNECIKLFCGIEELDSISTPINLHFIVPFISDLAKSKLQSFNKEYHKLNGIIYSSGCISHEKDHSELYLERYRKNGVSPLHTCVMAHKLPDEVSIGEGCLPKEYVDGSYGLYAEYSTARPYSFEDALAKSKQGLNLQQVIK